MLDALSPSTRVAFLPLLQVLLLVDASIPPMPLDVACADWFGDAQVSLVR